MAAAERAARSESERSRRQAERYLVIQTCSVCHGTRLRPEALSSRLDDRTIADIAARELGDVRAVAAQLPPKLPVELERLTTGLLSELTGALQPLLDLGLGYPSLDREGVTLSTGERQRIELTSTVRANTAGMLYVLDEPSVGLHPQTSRVCARRSLLWSPTAILWSSWSTTSRSSAAPTGSSSSAPAPASTAARSSPRSARPAAIRSSLGHRTVLVWPRDSCA